MLGNLKVDIIKYDYPWIDSPVTDIDIRMAGLKDIAAMKVAAVGGRGTKKDFYDIYFLLEVFSMLDIFVFF